MLTTALGVAGLLAGGFGRGFVLGLIGRWFGFGSVEMFLSYGGSYTGCSCLGFILMLLLFALAQQLVSSPLAIGALALACLGLVFWGFLHGLVANPWGWLGRTDDDEPGAPTTPG